jgi:YspA, cpYpsA-related SLOG family
MSTTADRVRVLVTGSRTWIDYLAVTAALDGLYAEYGDRLVVVHGGCSRGADLFADRWARAAGVRAERHLAPWRLYGRRAGRVRNLAMVATMPDLCLAFIRDASPGATHCANAARAAGIPTVIRRVGGGA